MLRQAIEILDLREENSRLYQLLDANQILSSSLDLNLVLDVLMQKARDVLSAAASSLMLLDVETDELYFHTIKGDKADEVLSIRLKIGEGIAGWVAQQGQSLLVADCQSDPRFSRKADDNSGFQTHTMMCAPLKVRGRIIGTVQVLNKENMQLFNEKDLAFFELLASQAAIAIENARLHEMATVDAMTGLYLKSYFKARLEDSYRRTQVANGQLSLLMSDIDFFKKVNDKYGHQGGDQALVELAQVIRDTVTRLDSDDIAGRYGGEEFCVLLPNSDATRALEVAELIRQNIESRPIQIGDQQAYITISIGIASFQDHRPWIHSAEDFVKLADEALYICKDRGRNCCALFTQKE
ncbi:MAG: sensor domain-containing diguanylate cyclase [Leptospiraceae bacterium]|nr:sensor domain-containing diguanylate cyclase [Leptospiraceae bacterium]